MRIAALGAVVVCSQLFGLAAPEAQQENTHLDWKPFENRGNLAVMYGDLVSPETHADGRVTFRVRAPQARKVTLVGAVTTALGKHGQELAFSAGPEGIWALTVGPLPPDIYNYRFKIDGVAVADPNNSHVGSGNQPPYSVLVVPGAEPAFYDVHPVPHGSVTRHIYDSTVVAGPRELYVYTPPGYAKGKQSHPTLYLMGGSGETAPGWFLDGRLQNTLDNLIAAKKAKPMLVVCFNNQMTHRRLPESDADWDAHAEKVAEELRKHVIPFVDSQYRTKRDARSRALAGLSMGARHTQYVGLRNLDLFASLAILSGSNKNLEGDDAILSDAKAMKKLRYLFVGRGKLEDEERTGPLAERLRKHGVPFVEDNTGGQAHDWSTWRHLMHVQVLPALFR